MTGNSSPMDVTSTTEIGVRARSASGGIFARNLAERISRRDGPNDIWTELIAIRNVYAHYTPGTIDSARVWFDAETDIERVLEQVRRSTG